MVTRYVWVTPNPDLQGTSKVGAITLRTVYFVSWMGPHMHRSGADREMTPGTSATDGIARARGEHRGQVLVIFAFLLTILLGMAAFVVDMAWIWSNQLQVQRAADAGALAGVVHLPGDPGGGESAAKAETRKNGFEDLVDGVVVTANPDPAFDRRMVVTVSAPVDTFFLGLFGFGEVTVSRTAKAEYVLPVPMGSPENYYGVFGMTRGLTSTAEVAVPPETTRNYSCGSGASWSASSGCIANVPSNSVSGTWTSSSGSLDAVLSSNNNRYARTSTNGAQSVWGDFDAQSGMPNPTGAEVLSIVGIQVRLTDAYINSTCASAHIDVDLSWGGGATGTWSKALDVPASGSLGTNSSSGDYVVGSSTATTDWDPATPHTWVRDDFSNTNFRVRLTSSENCSGSRTFSVDMLDVRITWDFTTEAGTTTVTTNLTDQLLRGPGTACTSGKGDCAEADGVALNARGFWGTLNTQGAENINGDAHQPYYDTRTGGVAPACSSVPGQERACYDPNNYYNYAVELPPNVSDGEVWIYDPGFCNVDETKGTGDRWFSGSAGVSTFYELYDTKNTVADLSDDGAPLFNSDWRFRDMDAADSTMGGGTGGDQCKYLAGDQYGDGRDYHNRWYRLASGLSSDDNGHVYRLHTTSTDPSNATAQLGTNGENSFAIFVRSSGTPRVYGLGAMQAFTPLTATGGTKSSEFYLAQIEAVHAGKTVEIHLWDPGDTQNLAANLQILIPDSSGWTPTTFNYTATTGTSNSGRTGSCSSRSATGTTSVTTNTGGTSLFNGCWLTIQAVIPSNYTAPQDGWWMIRYNMTGNDTSFDVTTWTVNIIGNPVHLILPG